MHAHLLQRAQLLREHRRFEQAIAKLHEFLALEPNSFSAHFELAVTRLLGGENHQQGLLDIERAISISPDSAAAHSVRSALLHALGRFRDALLAAAKAKSLDPEMPYAWFCEGNALLGLNQFPEAARAARKALELDPDQPSAPNLLAAALRLQRRFEEAEQVAQLRLSREPEDAWAFANAGWTALGQRQRHKAESLFLEALRLQPGLELARVGLRDAFKSRSLFYRLHLRHIESIRRKSELIHFFGGVAMIVVIISLVVILAAPHPLAAAAFIASFLLLFGPCLANGVGHLLLLKDRLARRTLNPGEKADGLLVGGLLLGGMFVLVSGIVVQSWGATLLGVASMGAAVPASFVFVHESVKRRMVFGLMSMAVIVCGVMAFLLGSDRPESPVLIVASMCIAIVSIGVFATFPQGRNQSS